MIARYLFRTVLFGIFVLLALILWLCFGWIPNERED